MKPSIDWFLSRLSENSTWRGLILVATAGFGLSISQDRAETIMAIGLMAVGIINTVRTGAPTKTQVAKALNEISAKQP